MIEASDSTFFNDWQRMPLLVNADTKHFTICHNGDSEM